MMDERMKILQMIEDQAITPADGLSLLEMVTQGRTGGSSAETNLNLNQDDPRWLRVNVTDTRSNEAKINVKIPLGLVEVSHRMGARFVPNMDEAAYAQLIQAAQASKPGKIYDSISADGSERIEIVVE